MEWAQRAYSRDRQRELLQARFYGAWDPTWIGGKIKELSSIEMPRRDPRCVGEGSHFVAYRVARPGSFEFSINLAKPEFGAGEAPGFQDGFASWILAIQAWPGGQGALIPPVEPMMVGESLALIMPFGPDPMSAASSDWHPLEDAIAATLDTLARQGFCLGDLPQGRSIDGVPFLYDFSDLRPVNSPRKV